MPSIEEKVGAMLVGMGLTIAVAEACTAGLVGSMLCSVPGSSRYFYGGVIAYTGGSKTKVLGIPEELIQRKISVSPEVATEMARRTRQLLGTDVGISTTGAAGPTGGTSDKPVGLFYVAVSAGDGYEAVKELRWNGDRNANREHTAWAALELVKTCLMQKS